MCSSICYQIHYFAGGHSTFFGLLNTFVHIIMYTYYMLAAMGPQMQKYLWWKKYLTALQMVISSFYIFYLLSAKQEFEQVMLLVDLGM